MNFCDYQPIYLAESFSKTVFVWSTKGVMGPMEKLYNICSFDWSHTQNVIIPVPFNHNNNTRVVCRNVFNPVLCVTRAMGFVVDVTKRVVSALRKALELTTILVWFIPWKGGGETDSIVFWSKTPFTFQGVQKYTLIWYMYYQINRVCEYVWLVQRLMNTRVRLQHPHGFL